jgi:hypothetical protein
VVTVGANGSVNTAATSTFTSDITGKVTANGTLSATLGNTEDRDFGGQSKENQEPMAAWIDQSRDREGTWQDSKANGIYPNWSATAVLMAFKRQLAAQLVDSTTFGRLFFRDN